MLHPQFPLVKSYSSLHPNKSKPEVALITLSATAVVQDSALSNLSDCLTASFAPHALVGLLQVVLNHPILRSPHARSTFMTFLIHVALQA